MRNWIWKKGSLLVRIPYSRSGVATNIFVDDGDTLLVLDAGDGVLRDLLDHHLPLARLRHVLLSHNHIDHTAGLLPLFFFFNLIQRHDPIQLYYPALGVGSLRKLLAIYEERPSSFSIRHRELRDQEAFPLGSFSVRPFFVHHKEPELRDPADPRRVSAVGFKLVHPEATVLYSGDAGYSPELQEEARGVDLAIVESTWGKDFEKFARGRSPEERAQMSRVHMTEAEALRVGEGAREHVLVHRISIGRHLRDRKRQT